MNEWTKQRDLLIEKASAFAQSIAANTPKRPVIPVQRPGAALGIASSAGRPLTLAEPASSDTPERERSVVQRRLANFKAHQERFEREREDYFQKTLAPKPAPTSGRRRTNRESASEAIDGIFRFLVGRARRW
jgi:hypothetical protein